MFSRSKTWYFFLEFVAQKNKGVTWDQPYQAIKSFWCEKNSWCRTNSERRKWRWSFRRQHIGLQGWFPRQLPWRASQQLRTVDHAVTENDVGEKVVISSDFKSSHSEEVPTKELVDRSIPKKADGVNLLGDSWFEEQFFRISSDRGWGFNYCGSIEEECINHSQ